jgi:hypothetical protein
VGHVQEEGFVLVAIDEVDRTLRVLGGELFLVLGGDVGVDDFGAVEERQIGVVFFRR